jgi:hypothetical protein
VEESSTHVATGMVPEEDYPSGMQKRWKRISGWPAPLQGFGSGWDREKGMEEPLSASRSHIHRFREMEHQ